MAGQQASSRLVQEIVAWRGATRKLSQRFRIAATHDVAVVLAPRLYRSFLHMNVLVR